MLPFVLSLRRSVNFDFNIIIIFCMLDLVDKRGGNE